MLVTPSCPILCDPKDCSSPGFSVHEILQARILEWISIPSSRGISQPRDRTLVSCIAGRFFTIWATRKSYTRIMLFKSFSVSTSMENFSSVQFSHSVVSDFLRPHGLQHARPPCPSPTPGVYSNSCPLSWWCHQTISSSVIPFFSHLQSFPASGSFQIIQLFTSGVSASTSVLPMNTQDWYPLGWTGWIFLQSKGLSRVFSNTTVQLYDLAPLLSFWPYFLPLILVLLHFTHRDIFVVPWTCQVCTCL